MYIIILIFLPFFYFLYECCQNQNRIDYKVLRIFCLFLPLFSVWTVAKWVFIVYSPTARVGCNFSGWSDLGYSILVPSAYLALSLISFNLIYWVFGFLYFLYVKLIKSWNNFWTFMGVVNLDNRVEYYRFYFMRFFVYAYSSNVIWCILLFIRFIFRLIRLITISAIVGALLGTFVGLLLNFSNRCNLPLYFFCVCIVFISALLLLLTLFFIWIIFRTVEKYFDIVHPVIGLYLFIGGSFLYFFWWICLHEEVYYINLGTWISCGLFVVQWGFLLDSLAISMLTTVSLISGCVHIYSLGYMRGDPGRARFLGYLSLFTFFMFILVAADNFIVLFLGWEGIGICSYLLISFWSSRNQANKAALKALIMNRVGDCGFLMGTILIYYLFRSVNFAVVFSLTPFFMGINIRLFDFFDVSWLDIIGICLFIGSMGKSAQLGLHTWLPDAMEGPTPVSALIHAATLVTAGVFLIVRCSVLYECAPLALSLILVIGASTAFFAATIAIFQYDIKKIIAYSTCSQLGYMFLACGLSAYDVTMFHLINHAFFKGLLFLAAGSIIHSLNSEQDIRKYGELVKVLPFAYVMFIIGSLALTGLPFLSGFYSKDIIIEMSYSSNKTNRLFFYWLTTIVAILTTIYSFNLLYRIFYSRCGFFSGHKYYLQNIPKLPLSIGFSLFILALGSIFSGFLLSDIFVGPGSTFWGNSIFIRGSHTNGLDYEFIPIEYKQNPVFYSIKWVLFVLFVYWDKIIGLKTTCMRSSALQMELQWFLMHKWYFDFLYNYFVGYFFIQQTYETFYKYIDKKFIEYFGPGGLWFSLPIIVKFFSQYRTGLVYQDNANIIFFLVFIFFILDLL